MPHLDSLGPFANQKLVAGSFCNVQQKVSISVIFWRLSRKARQDELLTFFDQAHGRGTQKLTRRELSLLS